MGFGICQTCGGAWCSVGTYYNNCVCDIDCANCEQKGKIHTVETADEKWVPDGVACAGFERPATNGGT